MLVDSDTVVDDAKRLIMAHRGCDGVVAAFVFGSRAWGDADPSSDIDVMVLLDQDDDFREVQRVRVSDHLDDQGSLPMFADIDQISYSRFAAAIQQGAWIQRLVNSIVIIDDPRYQAMRERATVRLADPAVRSELVRRRIDAVQDHCAAAERAIDSDLPLGILNARLGVEDAATALVEASGGRATVSHLIESFRTAVGFVGRDDLLDRMRSALAVNGGAGAVEQGLRSYRTIAEALRVWMAEPQIAQGLGPEHVAWAEFTYSPETYAEFDHKVNGLTRNGRTADALLYVDGLLRVPLRINTSKVFTFRETGRPDRKTIPGFHVALKSKPDLYSAWVTGLRLDGDRDDVWDAIATAKEIIAINEDVIAATT